MQRHELRFPSRYLQRTYTVWEVTAEDARTPPLLAVFLDGEFYLQRMETVSILEQLQQDGSIPHLACVFVSHIDPAARHRDYACNSDYTTFLAQELVPWAADAVGANPRRVLLAGLSLSGLAAATAALAHPDVFRAAICQSPSAWFDDERLAKWVSATPRVSARFWISVGRDETEADVRHPPTDMYQQSSQIASCRRLAAALNDRSVMTHLAEFDGGHDFACWERELPAAVKWVVAGC